MASIEEHYLSKLFLWGVPYLYDTECISFTEVNQKAQCPLSLC